MLASMEGCEHVSWYAAHGLMLNDCPPRRWMPWLAEAIEREAARR